jgi:hypothetical protein
MEGKMSHRAHLVKRVSDDHSTPSEKEKGTTKTVRSKVVNRNGS